MLRERTLPDSWINERGNDVTREFVDWCRPLAGGDLGDHLQFTKLYKKGKREA